MFSLVLSIHFKREIELEVEMANHSSLQFMNAQLLVCLNDSDSKP